MSQMNISMPPALKSWIDARVAEGRYTSASDFMRDLVRRNIEAADDETEWLRGLITEGLASGKMDRSAKDVLRDIMVEYPADRG